jgi:hypothetical protein
MKRNRLIFTFFVLLVNVTFAQKNIPFKEGIYVVEGNSGSQIKNMYMEESSVECFWKIDNDARTVQCTTIEIINSEHPDNNKNITFEMIKIQDIDQNLLPDEALEEFGILGMPYYTITISSENSGRKVLTNYCYIAQPDAKFLEQNPGFSFAIKFNTKESADKFLEELKSALLD